MPFHNLSARSPPSKKAIMSDPASIVMRNPYSRKRTRKEIPTAPNHQSPVKNAPHQIPTLPLSPKKEPSKNTQSSASALIIAAADKAGMQGIDRTRIDAIILRESGNSLFMQQQRRRDEKVNARIAQMQQKVEKEGRRPLSAELDAQLSQQILQRPNRSLCVVVDMDMFYMACELLTRPDLKELPACVGGRMILTSNYKARQYGVRSAMAGYIGDALVKELSGGKLSLQHVPSNFGLYKEKSKIVCAVLREYDPNLRAYSLDEAFLNIGPYLMLRMHHPDWSHEEIREAMGSAFDKEEEQGNEPDLDEQELLNKKSRQEGDSMIYDSSATRSNDDESSLQALNEFSPSRCLSVASALLNEMRQKVFDRTGGLTCSAGLAPNFLLAKIASDFNKPNGQCLVPSDHDSVKKFLWPLPIRKVSGIGRVTEKMCKAFGINTVQELYEHRALVEQVFTPVQAASLQSASVGCSRQHHMTEQSEQQAASQKGISRERTFQPISSWAEMQAKLAQVGELLSQDMQRKDFWAQTLTVKLKLHSYDVLSRARSTSGSCYWQSAGDLTQHATELLSELRQEFLKKNPKTQFAVRLLGIRCTNFGKTTELSGQMNMDAFLHSLQDDGNKKNDVNQEKDSTNKSGLIQPRMLSSEQALTAVPEASAFKRSPSPSQHVAPVANSSSTATNRQSSPPPPVLVDCPVCGLSFAESENDKLNQHVDACLNGTVVRQVIREEDSCYRKRKRKSVLTDYFSGMR